MIEADFLATITYINLPYGLGKIEQSHEEKQNEITSNNHRWRVRLPIFRLW